MIWMRVIPLDQPVTVGPKKGPPGHSEAHRGPQKGSFAQNVASDMGPPTGNRGAPGATGGPLFSSHMTLQ